VTRALAVQLSKASETRKLFPRLRELGVGQEQIDRLNHDNPRRFFGG